LPGGVDAAAHFRTLAASVSELIGDPLLPGSNEQPTAVDEARAIEASRTLAMIRQRIMEKGAEPAWRLSFACEKPKFSRSSGGPPGAQVEHRRASAADHVHMRRAVVVRVDHEPQGAELVDGGHWG
jgi:hypothetical protein